MASEPGARNDSFSLSHADFEMNACAKAMLISDLLSQHGEAMRKTGLNRSKPAGVTEKPAIGR